MSHSPALVTMSKAEYALIAGVLGSSTMIGIEDPFEGLLADELRATLDKTLEGLVEQGLAEVRADRRVVFEQQTGLVVSTCAFPEAVFILTRTHGDGTGDQRYFHITRTASAEMIDHDERSITLRRLDSPQRAFSRVQELLGLDALPTIDLPGAELPRTSLAQAVTLAMESGAEAAYTALLQSGVSQVTAEVLAGSMARPTLNASLVALAQQGERWATSGIALLLGDDHLWQLGPLVRHDEEWVSVTPCTAVEMKAEIGRLMQGVLPFPVTLS